MPDGLKDIGSVDHELFMQVAIDEAVIARKRGDKPIGAVLIHDSKIIGKMSSTWNAIAKCTMRKIIYV
jgi:tRNA(Arg) A34 adenosine deaminase TadA